MSQKIKELIINKYNQKQLANFYLLEPGMANQVAELNEWIQEILNSISAPQQAINCQDMLFIKPKDKRYKLGDFEGLTSFLSYKPIELQQKFIIIHEAEALNDLIMNKWLKVFEEPPLPVSIFLLNPNRSKLISTIYSRAIMLRPTFSKVETKLDLDQLCNSGFKDFQEKLEAKNLGAMEILSTLSALLVRKEVSFVDYEAMQKRLKSIEAAILYNNSKTSIDQQIYALIKDTLTVDTLKQ